MSKLREIEGTFVPVPTEVFQELLRHAFSGTQWRIILWVIRNTFGWHRGSAPWSWYRMAKDLGADRGGVVRAGRELVSAGVLKVQEI